MPRKAQGWITFQSSEEERQLLDQICQQTQRTKTEVLREMLRNLGQAGTAEAAIAPTEPIELDEDDELPTASDTAVLQSVKISARNILKAKVKRIVRGTVNAEVTLTIAPDVELVSIITRSSADKLQLKKGKTVFAVIKASNVMIAEA